MNRNWLLTVLIVSIIASCTNTSNGPEPVVPPSLIEKDLMSWLYYERDHMRWSADFQALDTSLKRIERSEFLKQLTTGNYLPVKIRTSDSALCYQLYRAQSNVDEGIRRVIRNKAQMVYRYLQFEGSHLPGFNFTDLNGNVYNRENTKGKIVVLNCWFVRCQPCNEEMPELNKIVDKTKDRNDIVFLGLAFDKADSLKQFLTKKEFKYAIVPDKENYLMNDLGIIYYPTHIIINRQGKIRRIIEGSVTELIDALNNELQNVN
ncbi:MAG: TlpA family protein disulfide reductase [Flavisolibacter sp.]|nr:TlpA family protein disulfide reductase [Flavisolibacter sp.]